MKKSMQTAFCGMIAALSVVLMFFTGIIPFATISLPALAGCLLILVTAQLGTGWGLSVYAVCAVLVLILAPDREAAVYYVLFFGYYPVITALLGRIRGRVPRYIAKLAIFNAAVAVSALIVITLLGPLEEIPLLGRYTAAVLWMLANIMFVLYDLALDRLIALYYHKIHNKLFRALRK